MSNRAPRSRMLAIAASLQIVAAGASGWDSSPTPFQAISLSIALFTTIWIACAPQARQESAGHRAISKKILPI